MVQRGIYGGALQPLYTNVDVSAFPTHSDVSFGKGKAAEYQFDDLRLQADTISALSASRRYEYDALGRRVLQTVLVEGVPVNTFFIYDGERVIEEYCDQEGGAHQLLARYVYGQYIDEVLQRELDLDNNGDPELVHYYLHDDLYNVVGVTDDTGKLVERYEYGEYGKPTIYEVPASGPEVEISASLIANRYMFNGRDYDSGTGLYWYRTRYMDPEQGRFIARDTRGAWGDANNLGNPFAYVGNNPWSRLDPYGLYGSFGAGPGDPIRWRMEHWNEYMSVEVAEVLDSAPGGATVYVDSIAFGFSPWHERAEEVQADARARGDVLSQVGYGLGRAGGHALGILGLISGGGAVIAPYSGSIEAAMVAHPTLVATASYGGTGLLGASAVVGAKGAYDAFGEGDYATGISSSVDAGLSAAFEVSMARFANDFRTIGRIVRSEGSTQGIHHSSFTTALQASRLEGNLGQAAGRTRGAATAMRQGRVIVTKQSSGGVVRTHHPTVRSALETSSRPHAGTFGHCGEPACASVFARVEINLRGAEYVTTRIRKPGHQAHGTIIIPCRHCESIINSLGR